MRKCDFGFLGYGELLTCSFVCGCNKQVKLGLAGGMCISPVVPCEEEESALVSFCFYVLN